MWRRLKNTMNSIIRYNLHITMKKKILLIQGEVRDLQSLNKLSDLLDSEARVQGPNDTCVASTVDGCTTGDGDGDPCIFPFTYKVG